MNGSGANRREHIPLDAQMALTTTRWWQRVFEGLRFRNFVPLLFSTITAELAGNVVYVMLMEKAFAVREDGASVGLVLVIQAVTQTTLGSWAGTVTDRIGIRKASAVGLIGQAMLTLGLVVASSIWILCALAFLITLTRSLIIPARLSLATRLSARTSLVTANTAILTLTGLGLFLGPAVAATLVLISNNSSLPLLVAGSMLFVSYVPFISKKFGSPPSKPIVRVSIWSEMRHIWEFIAQHRLLWEVLICFSFSTITFGAIVPLITPLARQSGFGSEGSGWFVAALGFGWTVGPMLAASLFQRFNLTFVLFVTGLLTPLPALFIGFVPLVPGIIIALVLSSAAGAALNMVVITILLRFTPIDKQGRVIGSLQTLSGLVWSASAALITGILAIAPSNITPRMLFYPIGSLGALMVLACWFFGKRTLPDSFVGAANRLA